MKQLVKNKLTHLKNKIEFQFNRKIVKISLMMILLVLIFFGRYITEIFFVVLLTLIGAISMMYNKVIRTPLGFELCIFGSVLSSVKYGPLVGALVGFVSLLFSFILSNQFQYKSFISLIALPLVATLAYYLQNYMSILAIGLIVTVIYDLMILPLYVMLGSTVHKSIIYFLTHIIFNFWIFNDLAPFFLGLM